jgi:hypothetical protein
MQIKDKVKTPKGRTGTVMATYKPDGVLKEVLVWWFNGECKWISPDGLEHLVEGKGE